MNLNIQSRLLLILSVAVAMLLLINIRTCNSLSDAKRYASRLAQENSRLTKKTLADSSVIYSARVANAEIERELAQALAEKAQVRNPVAAARVVTRTVVRDTIYIGEVAMTNDSTPCLPVPAPIQKHTRWYSFDGMLTEGGYLSIDSLSIPAEFTWSIGDTVRAGFWNKVFRRKDSVVRVHVDNPHVEVNELVAVVEERKGKGRGLVIAGMAGVLAALLIFY